jgi:hypothetical protein
LSSFVYALGLLACFLLLIDFLLHIAWAFIQILGVFLLVFLSRFYMYEKAKSINGEKAIAADHNFNLRWR